MSTWKKVMAYLVIAGLALGSAVIYELFIFPNQFAPSGIYGICTMIQHVTGLNMGYLSFLFNLPLAIAVFFKVSRSLAIRAMTYVACFSTALVLLDFVDLSFLAYDTENGTSVILGPLAASLVNGSFYAMLLRAGTYTGGTDFAASLIHLRRPDFNFFYVTFGLNAVVAIISFFVYDYKPEPVLLCILYSFITSTVTDRLNKSGRSAVRFEIITGHPEEISREIIHELHHSATLLPGRGMFRGQPTSILICIVNKTQAARLSAIVRSYPHTFAVSSQVGEVMGNFKRIDNQGNPERELLDLGDGTGI